MSRIWITKNFSFAGRLFGYLLAPLIKTKPCRRRLELHQIGSSPQIHATVRSSNLKLGMWRSMAYHRASDRLMVFSHDTSFTQEVRAVETLCFSTVFVFVISCYQVRLSYPLWIHVVSTQRYHLFSPFCQQTLIITHTSVCCSSVTLHLEPTEDPCTMTYHPTSVSYAKSAVLVTFVALAR